MKKTVSIVLAIALAFVSVAPVLAQSDERRPETDTPPPSNPPEQAPPISDQIIDRAKEIIKDQVTDPNKPRTPNTGGLRG